MKLTCLFLALSALCSAQEATVSAKASERLAKLAQSYDAAVERAVSLLRKTYLTELDKLKLEFTKAGDLSGALAADAAIKKLTPAPVVVENSGKPAPAETDQPNAQKGKELTLAEKLKVLPAAPRGVTRREQETWLAAGVWRFGTQEWFRFDKGGKGARFTNYAGVETITWQINPEGLLEVSGGNRKHIRLTTPEAGVGIMLAKYKDGVQNFVRETKEVPELAVQRK